MKKKFTIPCFEGWWDDPMTQEEAFAEFGIKVLGHRIMGHDDVLIVEAELSDMIRWADETQYGDQHVFYHAQDNIAYDPIEPETSLFDEPFEPTLLNDKELYLLLEELGFKDDFNANVVALAVLKAVEKKLRP